MKMFQGGDPRLALALVPLVEAPRRKVRASRPPAVLALQVQQPVTPALDGRPRALQRDDLSWRMDKIAQHLPRMAGSESSS